MDLALEPCVCGFPVIVTCSVLDRMAHDTWPSSLKLRTVAAASQAEANCEVNNPLP